MNGRNRAAVLLLALLLACLAVLPGEAVDTIYFTAINNTLLELNDATMPVHRELMARKGRYYELYCNQFRRERFAESLQELNRSGKEAEA